MIIITGFILNWFSTYHNRRMQLVVGNGFESQTLTIRMPIVKEVQYVDHCCFPCTSVIRSRKCLEWSEEKLLLADDKAVFFLLLWLTSQDMASVSNWTSAMQTDYFYTWLNISPISMPSIFKENINMYCVLWPGFLLTPKYSYFYIRYKCSTSRPGCRKCPNYTPGCR